MPQDTAVAQPDDAAPVRAPGRRRLTLSDRIATAWLASLGVAAMVVGGHDAVAGTAINLRLVGSLLLAGGVMLLIGAAGLWHRQPTGLSLAMIAAVTGVAIGVMTFLTQVVNDDPDERLIAWALIIIGSAAAAVHVRSATSAAERAKSIMSRLPILKSAISVGLVFSVAQFWYANIYLPTAAPVSLTLDAKIDSVTPAGNDKHVVVKGSVVIENTSKAKVQVLASTIDVKATRLELAEFDDDEFTGNVNEANREKLTLAERHVSEEEAEYVTHGRLVSERKFFEAGEKITVPFLTWVPKDSYNAVYVESWIASGRANALGLEKAQPPAISNTAQGEAVYLTRLPNAGWLHVLTRGDRYLRVAYDDDPNYETEVDFANDGRPDPPDGFSDRLARFYGVAQTENSAVVAVP